MIRRRDENERPQRMYQPNGQPRGQGQPRRKNSNVQAAILGPQQQEEFVDRTPYGPEGGDQVVNVGPNQTQPAPFGPLENTGISGYGFPNGRPTPPLEIGGQTQPTGPTNTRETRDALGGYNRQIPGFRTDDYEGDVKARNSMKNTFGRIASRYQGVPSSMEALFADADFQRYFPNARRVQGGAGDMIDFGGMLSDFETGVPVNSVDVGMGFDPATNAGQDWGWIDHNQLGVGGQQAPQGPPISQGGGPASQIYDQALRAIMGPQQQQQQDPNQLLLMLMQLMQQQQQQGQDQGMDQGMGFPFSPPQFQF